MESVDISRETLQEKVKSFLANGGEVEKVEPKPARKRSRKSSKPHLKLKRPAGKRRPILTSWAMIGVKQGTKLTCKLSDKVTLVTCSDVTMESEVHIKGRKPRRFLGVMASELYVREYLKKPVKSPQGWDVFILPQKHKGKTESVHDRYTRVV